MIKFIEHWMFASHLWNDADPSPVAINIREITRIEQIYSSKHGEVVAVFLKNDDNPIFSVCMHFTAKANHKFYSEICFLDCSVRGESPQL